MSVQIGQNVLLRARGWFRSMAAEISPLENHDGGGEKSRRKSWGRSHGYWADNLDFLKHLRINMSAEFLEHVE